MENNESESAKTPGKTISTRYTANPQFAAKNKVFLANLKKNFLEEDTFSPSSETDNLDPGLEKPITSKSIKKEVANTSLISVKSLKNDHYCWSCHLPKATVACGTCTRSYHSQCLPPRLPAAGFVCAECKEPGEPWPGPGQFSTFGVYVIKNVLRDQIRKKNEILIKISKTRHADYIDKILKPMDMLKITKKNERGAYPNGKAFLSDVKWLHHNSIVYFGASDTTTVTAKKLLNMFTKHIADLEHCPQCYERAHEGVRDWFTLVCDKPHPVVFAKVRGYPFWPSKVLFCDATSAKCWFFGPHDKATVTFNNLLLVSKDNLAMTMKKNAKLQNALEEMRSYVTNYEKKFGLMKLFPNDTIPTKTQLFGLLPPQSSAHSSKPAPSSQETPTAPSEAALQTDLRHDADAKSPEETKAPTSPPSKPKKRSASTDRANTKKHRPMPLCKMKEEALRLESCLAVALERIPESELRHLRGKSSVPCFPTKSFEHQGPFNCTGQDDAPISIPSSPIESAPLLLSDEDEEHLFEEPSPSKGSSKKQNLPITESSESLSKQIIELFTLPKEKETNADIDEDNDDDDDEEEDILEGRNLLEEYKRLQKLVEESEQKLQLQKSSYEKKIKELGQSNKVAVLDIRKTWDQEKNREILKTKLELEKDFRRKVEENKRKHWCSSCGLEARYLCCWNTAYCSYKCQSQHWEVHSRYCSQLTQTITLTSEPRPPTTRPAYHHVPIPPRPISIPPPNRPHQVVNSCSNGGLFLLPIQSGGTALVRASAVSTQPQQLMLLLPSHK